MIDKTATNRLPTVPSAPTTQHATPYSDVLPSDAIIDTNVPDHLLSRQELVLRYLIQGDNPNDAISKAGYNRSTTIGTLMHSPAFVARLQTYAPAVQAAVHAAYRTLGTVQLLQYDLDNVADPKQPKVRERIAKVSGLQGPDSGPGSVQVAVQVNLVGDALDADLGRRRG